MMSLYRQNMLPLALLFFALIAFLVAPVLSATPSYPALKRSLPHRPQNISVAATPSDDLSKARKIVAEAVRQQGEYNSYRVANPRTNKYYTSNSNAARAFRAQKLETEPAPPTLNDTIRAAATLVAEHDAAAKAKNGTLNRVYPKPRSLSTPQSNHTKRAAATEYWVANVEHNGLAPMGGDSSWLVYRDVTNPMFAGGAKGDGVTDDTAAINAAIAYGGNCGLNCLSSSVKGTFIFFPQGVYLVSSPIEAYYYSQLVGDAIIHPTIRASVNFIGLAVIESDVYIPNDNGNEWYIDTSNFYRQIRNINIDIIDTVTPSVSGLHWQVAQATSVTNCRIFAPTTAGTTAIGMFTENGSSGFMGDCFFSGGQYGLYGGNQQYTVRGFEFSSQTTASICLIWDWGWTWSQLEITNSPIGIKLINPQDTTGPQAGSIYVLDSLFENVETAIFANDLPATILGSSIITLDNIGVLNVGTMIGFVDGSVFDVSPVDLDFLIVGNIEEDGEGYGKFYANVNVPDPSMLDSNNQAYARQQYYTTSRPQYEGFTSDQVINVKDHGVKGDGSADDTSAIQAIFQIATLDNLIYFPAGSYIVTSTLTIQPGSQITGQVWSQLVASGSYFANMSNPQIMLKVGSSGDVGVIEISDMLFTSIGSLPGLIMVEWNIAADAQGNAGLWDTHFRVGGALGTDLQVAQCPSTVPSIEPNCVAATMMLHLTPSSNGYFENMWAWVADHDLDDPNNAQVSVAVARGILVESSGPTWMLGTASEHSILYQYNFFGTVNTLAGMIQTESPYYQYTTVTESPGPFNASVGLFSNDPLFPDASCSATTLLCSFAWSVVIQATANLTIAGAGLYSWFDNYDQAVCVDAQNCQQRLLNNQGANDQLLIWNLVTIGAVEMISDTNTGTIVYAKNNTQATAHPFWSIFGSYADDFATESTTCSDNDTSAECNTAQTCDFTLDFDSIDSLWSSAQSGSFPGVCAQYYALGALGNTLDAAINNYTAADDGYDDLFGDYVKFTKNMIPTALQTFLGPPNSTFPAGGPGNKYFTCELSNDGVVLVPNQNCPIPPQQYDYLTVYTMTYTLEDSDGFFNELADTYGIQQSWVDFTTVKTDVGCSAGSGHGSTHACAPVHIAQVGYPTDSGNVTVSNPKDVFNQALPTIGNISATIIARQLELITGAWFGPTDDLVQVISMPVMMITQAVNDMMEVKVIGEKEKKELQEQLTWEILGFVFAFIPFLDELTPEIEGLGLILSWVDVGANTALAIQDIIANPESAPMEIFGLLTAGGTRDEDDFAQMAATRRGISEDDLGKIGTTFQKLDTKLQDIVKSCKA